MIILKIKLYSLNVQVKELRPLYGVLHLNDLNGLGGVFCEDCDIAKRKSEVDESLQRYIGVANWAVDTDEATRLWELSEEIIT